MKQPASRRKAVAVAAIMPVTFTLGVMLAVSVASASGPLPTTTTTTSASTTGSSTGFDLDSPQAQFLVINGTVNAASDHEIVGSSAFPNFTTGAVDNYYSMSRSHMDNSPFSEGTASPEDTGPAGQTAAAGNFQQPQYADARWPGGPDKTTYGTSGQPFAEAAANESLASADASEASNGLSGPGLGGTKTLAVPKGFDDRLQKALAAWKTTYLGCPTAPTPPPPLPKVNVPTAPKVTTPTATVTTPVGPIVPVVTVAAPLTAGAAPPTPSESVPSPALPRSVGATGGSRSLSAIPTPCSSASESGSDGESLLTSSTLGVLVPGPATTNTDITKVDTTKLRTTPAATTQSGTTLTGTAPTAWTPKPYTLMMSGESSMGRVTLGHGQIVIEGIHVTAAVANDGTATPAYKTNISVAAASIGGVPVTIDQDGVNVAGQHQGLPYQQASDALNTALKQAGIQLFLVAPEVTNCGQAGTGTNTSSTASTTTTTTTTTTSDQSGAASPCGQAGATCNPGTGTGTDTTATTTTTTPPTLTDQSGMTTTPSSCVPPAPCGPTGTATGGGTSGSTGSGGSTTTTTTTTTGQTDTTGATPSWCPPTAPMTSSCGTAGKAPDTTPTSTDQSGTTVTPGATSPTAMGGTMGSTQETIVSATGVHVVFTQPVSPSGVPAQFVEHILGEVYVDSLAAPATPLPSLGLLPSSLSSPTSTSSSCLHGRHSRSTAKKTSGGGGGGGGGASTAGGSSLAGGSTASSSLSPSGSALGSASQTNAGSTGNSLPAAFAAALRKPLWLLLAYLVWQALVLGTGMSLWNWRRDGAS